MDIPVNPNTLIGKSIKRVLRTDSLGEYGDQFRVILAFLELDDGRLIAFQGDPDPKDNPEGPISLFTVEELTGKYGSVYEGLDIGNSSEWLGRKITDILFVSDGPSVGILLDNELVLSTVSGFFRLGPIIRPIGEVPHSGSILPCFQNTGNS